VRRAIVITTFAVVAGLLAPAASSALEGAPGLDPGFNGTGLTETDFGGCDYGEDVVIQTDGKVVVAGATETFFQGEGCFGSDFAVARYLPNGLPDPGFGGGDGRVDDFFNGESYGYAVALQTVDGEQRIVVGGRTCLRGCDWALARLVPDGSLDPGFGGGDGLVTVDMSGGGRSDEIHALAIQPTDQKIVAAGVATSTSFNGRFTVARFNVDGTLDGSFDGPHADVALPAGAVVSPCFEALSPGDEAAQDVVIQGNGKIVAVGDGPHCASNGGSVVGRSNGTSVGQDFLVARLNDNGTLDTSFSGDGWTHTDFGGDDLGQGVVLQPDGEIVVSGAAEVLDNTRRVHPSNGLPAIVGSDFALARYQASGPSAGELDPGFGTSGQILTDFQGGVDGATDVAIDGALIIAAGFAEPGSVVSARFPSLPDFDSDFAMAGYSMGDGALDESFGDLGLVMTDVDESPGIESYDIANAIAIQPDHKIVLAGWVDEIFIPGKLVSSVSPMQVGIPPNFAAARYVPTPGGGGGGVFKLTVILRGEGSGKVTSSPPAIFCPPICEEFFDAGTPVQLLKAANAGSTFARWGADCVGSGFCQVIMDSEKIVLATFDPAAGEAAADLALTKTSSADPTVGDALTYTLTVTNLGPDAAANVTLTDELAATLVSPTTNPSQGTCALTGSAVACDLGPLASGATATVEISATPIRGGSVANSATVSASTHDPDLANNTASVEIAVEAQCTVEGTDGPDNLTGTPGIDVLCGKGGDDTLRGFGKHDVLLGGPGADELIGGSGNDMLRGGSGPDDLDAADGVEGNDVARGGGGVDTCVADPNDSVTSC
jgi:uncharacterized repeat protein (TIGR01451 family)/uncharacterized delta-60 repeat protein